MDHQMAATNLLLLPPTTITSSGGGDCSSAAGHHQLPLQQYRGVRKRKWGKWVSEIRQPGTKTRIWLGSFESPEMAAVAHDVAALRLRGRDAQLNFPGSVGWLPRPATTHPADVRAAASEAADRVRREPSLVALAATSRCHDEFSGLRAVPVEMAGSDEEFELDLGSPRLWAEMAEAMLLDPPRWDTGVSDTEVAHCWSHGSLWDAC
ncbi:hypothetical protein PR202_gb15561 [Eleusine coracana subsp. coracana]|uniref:AP2/ERF domain-containing protein n=1 Tax=Eleusine coracana subsp. coracana TaxID=191504 RepID=A0AAV5EY41_ELECO|nr:hypothetical protein QOZ80_4BG0347650 [Eleusine coracana subsp. coracana]GJN27531.1 hypothetical protein PR202_gb15561 [Eleusine coracana subsp. coracana]